MIRMPLIRRALPLALAAALVLLDVDYATESHQQDSVADGGSGMDGALSMTGASTGGVGGGAWVTVGCPGVSPHPSLVGRCRKKSGDGRGLEKL